MRLGDNSPEGFLAADPAERSKQVDPLLALRFFHIFDYEAGPFFRVDSLLCAGGQSILKGCDRPGFHRCLQKQDGPRKVLLADDGFKRGQGFFPDILVLVSGGFQHDPGVLPGPALAEDFDDGRFRRNRSAVVGLDGLGNSTFHRDTQERFFERFCLFLLRLFPERSEVDRNPILSEPDNGLDGGYPNRLVIAF